LQYLAFRLADDLGMGDLSINGQINFTTPNLDRLASEGITFTQHYAGSTVCAPSRSCLLTGLHTGHTPIRDNKEILPEGQVPMPDETFTLAEMLKKQGYVTGAFGKWGLGFPGSEGDPNMQGFDTFYGYNCQRKAHSYYPYYLWDNQEKDMLEGNEGFGKGDYAPELIHKQALKFMEEHKDEKFFMYYPMVIPHAELAAPEEFVKMFRGKFGEEKVYEGVDEGENFRDGPYASQEECHAVFAAMVTLLDHQVGEVIAKLKELGIDDNTLIIFTSDNGPHLEGGADPRFFNSNGKFKGFKRDLYEGGIRVPTIARWSGKIKAGSESDHISAFWDIYPTFAELAGGEVPESIDGISFLPSLLGEDGQKEHEYLYWEFRPLGGRVAIRKGDWKFVRYRALNPEKYTTELYDLSKDPSEVNNLAEEHPDLVKEMTRLMEEAHTDSELFEFEPVL
jgi:arylsulfatase A